MAGLFIVHSGRCAKTIAGACKDFVLGKHTFGSLFRKVNDSISDSWHDYKTPPLTPQRKDAMQLVNRGARLYNTKRYSEALDAFKSATEQDPTYSRAYVYLGNTLYKLAKQPEAMHAWERAVSADPMSSAALKAREKIAQINSQHHKAISDLREGLQK